MLEFRLVELLLSGLSALNQCACRGRPRQRRTRKIVMTVSMKCIDSMEAIGERRFRGRPRAPSALAMSVCSEYLMVGALT